MRPKTVLIADDDADLVKAITLRCHALGVRVRSTNNALGLLNAINREPPDLACIDVEMPCGTGLTACELLVADPELARIPLVILTGKSDPETIRRCHSLNAYYVLKCPDVWSRLKPLLAEVLKLETPKLSPRGHGNDVMPAGGWRN